MARLGEHLADWLHDAGTEHVFGLMASGSVRMVGRLAELGIPFHNARHESSAVAMADGYARVGGGVGVCSVTQGPGVTNSLTALVTARRARSPLVLLASDASGADPRSQRFQRLQAVDQIGIFEVLGIPVVQITAEDANHRLDIAFDLARSGTPVVASIAVGSQHDDVAEPAAAASPPPARRDAPDAGLVAEVAGLLTRARRPLLLAGLGAVRSGAGPAIAELADRCHALLATTLRAIELFHGDDRSLGVLGGFAWPEQLAAAAEADCVVAFGAGLNPFTTERGTLLAGARLVQIDIDPEASGRHHDVDLFVRADARTAAEALAAALEDTAPRAPRRAPPRVPPPLSETTFTDGLDPRRLCAALDGMLPEERTLITDSGHFTLFPVDYMSVPDPAGLVFPLEFGSMGLGIGAAIGAALARRDRLAVLFIGDGGFFMTLGDLDVAVRDGIRLLVVVMNDRAYGSEVHQMHRLGLDPSHAHFETPDLAAVARALGARAEQITDLDQLEALPGLLDDGDGPVVLDCPITRSVVARQFLQPGA